MITGEPLKPSATDKNTDKPLRELRLRWLSDVEKKETKYFWKPYLPWGMLILFSGDPSTAKSSFAHKIAAMLTRGKTFSDFGTDIRVCETGNVMAIAAEESVEKTMKARFELLGGDDTKICVVEMISHDENSDEPFVLNLTADDLSVIEE